MKAVQGLPLALMLAWCSNCGAGDLETECEEVLSQAELAVARARSREALWTTAAGALREARRLRRAREAQRLSDLGLQQLDYPPERESLSPAPANNGGFSQ
jgi:hypothetical protein